MTDYGDWFFDLQTQQSSESAAVVAPIVVEMLPITSVLDVGGGVGAWAAAFAQAGAHESHCIDGDYVRRRQLLVPESAFRSHDLTQPLDLGRRYSLCVCLEVGEHLSLAASSTLVASLVRHADAILFSAAIPQQGGERHINEQWPSFWRQRFADHGYEPFDVIRPRIWSDSQVGFWFRQNLFVYAINDAARQLRSLPFVPPPFDLVHPELWTSRNAEPAPSIRTALVLVGRALRRRLAKS